MFQFPKYFILIFVGLSVLTAVVIHKLQNSPTRSSREIASSDPISLADQMRSIVSSAGSTEALRSINHQQNSGCMCQTDAGLETDNTTFEDPASCSKDRLYLKPFLSRIPALYRETRAKNSADFPIECVAYTLRMTQVGAEKQQSKFFTRCASEKSAPDGTNMKPCVSKNYTTVIYNYFSDMTDCFDLDQRSWIPKLFRESGFHLNARSATGALGIGQLTSVAIEEANKEFKDFQMAVESSDKASCQRLKSVVKKLSPVTDLYRETCSKTVALQNPALNLFYAVVSDLQNRKQIESLTNRKGSRFDIYGRMEALGLKSGDYDKERLVNMLATLGYNAGAGSAVLLLSSYLDYFKMSYKRPLRVSDFNLNAVKGKELTFFEYARRYQNTGNTGWLDDLNKKAKELNTQFKEGTCVPDSYLSL